jgi:hypothetical protein
MPTRERENPDYMTREEIEYEAHTPHAQDRGLGNRPCLGTG